MVATILPRINGGSSMGSETQSDLEQVGQTVASNGGDWMNKRWRPAMGWSYMLTCLADFVIFPILWSLLQAVSSGSVTTQWQPITLQGAGLYHLAMGAILGIAAYGRTKEKMEGKA